MGALTMTKPIAIGLACVVLAAWVWFLTHTPTEPSPCPAGYVSAPITLDNGPTGFHCVPAIR